MEKQPAPDGAGCTFLPEQQSLWDQAAAGVEKLLRENAKEYPRLPALWADAAAAQN